MNRLRRVLLAAIAPLLLFFLWWLITAMRIVSPLYLPSPADVIVAARDTGFEIVPHALATLGRLVAGFGLGYAIGYCIGILMVLHGSMRVVIQPMVDSARPAPVTATLPFFLLWFGFAWQGQLLFIALGVAVIIASAVVDASKAVSPQLVRVGQTFEATKWQMVRTVLMPGLLPQLVPTIRVCLGIAGSLTIVSEFMGADTGIGTMLDVARRTLRTEALVWFSIVLAAIVLACDVILRVYLNHTLRWMPSSSEAIDVSTESSSQSKENK